MQHQDTIVVNMSDLKCADCGRSMKLRSLDVIEDHKRGNRFIDVVYVCKNSACNHIKVARYKEEYFFCNFSTKQDMIKYKPDMSQRDSIFAVALVDSSSDNPQ